MDAESSIKSLGHEALRDLYNNLAGAKDFMLSQAPDVCRQVIQWEIVCGVICAAVLACALFVSWRFIKAWRDKDEWELPWIISACALTVGGPFLIMGILSAVKALIAPKLFLLEYIARLIK
jgi:hypothetical protein